MYKIFKDQNHSHALHKGWKWKGQNLPKRTTKHREKNATVPQYKTNAKLHNSTNLMQDYK